MRKNTLLWQMLAVAFIMLAAGAQGQVPQLINYQGQLTDASGNPLSGTHTIVFSLYDKPTTGPLLWEETHMVTVTNGFYSVLLGAGTPPNPIPLNLFDFGAEVYLQLTVGSEVLTPRQRLGSVPYAFRSQATLDRAYDEGGPGAGRTITADAGAVNIAGPGGLTVNGNVGIGTTSPGSFRLMVAGGNTRLAAAGQEQSLFGLDYIVGVNDLRFAVDDLGSDATQAMFLGSNGLSIGYPNTNPPAGTRLLINGNVGIGTTSPQSRLHVMGTTTTEVLQITGGSDLSEQFEINGANEAGSEAAPEQAQPGMVVSIDPEQPGKLVISTEAYDHKVAGIISGAGGINTGMLMGQNGSSASGSTPVALAGRVYCWADASYGAIEPGDLLTTSDTPGHAMKVIDHAQAQGAILGKAMTPLVNGKGLVLVLVTLQ